MKKVSYQIIILALLCSCAMKKHRVPTAALDLDTKSVVPAKSIALEKGKICYIYTTQYVGLLPGQELLTPKSEANFLPQMLGTSALLGGASSTAKVDTALNNDLLVQTALQEVIDNRAPGFQFQFVPQEEFTDSMGNLKAEMVQTKFDPDIIINLRELTLTLAGDANKGVNVVTSQPMMEMPGEYSSISPATNYYGYIHMDYTATWEIVDVKEDQKKQIQLTGRYVSKYHPKYSMYVELMSSAKKAGKDFAALIK